MKKDFSKGNKNHNFPKYTLSTNYDNIFENMDLGVSIFELILDKGEKIVDLHVNFVNRKSLLNKLKPHEEIIGKTINGLLKIDKTDFYLNMAREVIFTGKSLSYESYFEELNKYFLINAFSVNKNLFVTLDLDITREKETEEELRDTLKHSEIEKKQLSAIVENIPVGIIIAESPSGKFLLANKQIAEIWRYPQTASADEFKKYKGFHPDGRPYKPGEWPLSRSIRTGEIIKDEEIQILRGDGTKGWLSVSSVPVHDDGNIIMGIVIDLDITERKKAEDELKESKRRLEAIIQGSPVLTFIIDTNHRVIHWNKAIEEYSGIKAEEMVGTKNHWKALYNEKRPTIADLLIEKNFDRISKIYTGKYKRSTIVDGAYEIEDFFPTMGEEGRWLRATVSVIEDSEGNIVGSMEILEDITERKQAEEKLKEAHDNLEEEVKERTAELKTAYELMKENEEKFRELFNKATEIIVLSEFKENGMPGKFIEVNEAASKILGYSKYEFGNMTPVDLFAPEKRDKLPQIAVELLNNGFTTFEAISITKNRKEFPVEVNVHVFKLRGRNVALAIARDISERKKAEEVIKESEGKFRALYDDNPSIYFTVDSELMILSVNQFGAELLGYKVHELIGQPLSLVFYDKDREFAAQNLKHTLENHGKVFHWELRKVRKDNSMLWVKETARAVKESDENVVIYTVCEDITDRKKAEEALKESEKKFRELFNQATDMLSLTELNDEGIINGYIEVNKTASKRLGYSKEELLNMSPLDLYLDNSTIKKMVSELLEKGYSIAENIQITKDGMQIPVELNTHLFKLKGKNVVLSISRDISERKKAEESLRESVESKSKILNALIESEEKLNATIESSPDSITVSDLNLKITSCNQATVVMYGASSKDEIIGLRIHDLVVPKYHQLITETMSRLLREMKSVTLEVELYRKNDSVFPAEISANVVKDVNGKPISFVGITKDISERKNAEREREDLINDLKRSNKELQQFAYVASHDLQEPLRTIASFTELIERRYRGQLDKDADEFIEFIVDGTNRMQAMIKDLLQYSRVQTKGGEFTSTDIQKALDQALSNLKVSIEENNAEITHDELPTVVADEKQFIQLFQNLISNAIKFRKEEEPPKIHISACKDEEKNEYVFAVSDNGIGMDPEQSKRIFEIFQRLHTREEYKGTGIGLAVAKKILERHGGRIWVESEPEKGTTFYFAIPIL